MEQVKAVLQLSPLSRWKRAKARFKMLHLIEDVERGLGEHKLNFSNQNRVPRNVVLDRFAFLFQLLLHFDQMLNLIALAPLT